MNDGQIGSALRGIRQRRRWRQVDLAARARVSRRQVGRIERGHLEEVGLAVVRRVSNALDARLDLTLRWQGADLDRLLNRRHAAMHEAVARLLGRCDGWLFQPEVSFSIYGERGVIDVLAWHSARRVLLVIEIKTEIVDVNDLMGSVDRKRRLAFRIGQERGWAADAVGVWVIVAEGSTNRRRIAAHREVLRRAFPRDGRSIRHWLPDPRSPIGALSFLSNGRQSSLARSRTPRRRVRNASRPRGNNDLAQPSTALGSNGPL